MVQLVALFGGVDLSCIQRSCLMRYGRIRENELLILAIAIGVQKLIFAVML